jgi:hypothetical protein
LPKRNTLTDDSEFCLAARDTAEWVTKGRPKGPNDVYRHQRHHFNNELGINAASS